MNAMQKYLVIIICYCLFPFLALHAQTQADFSQLNQDLKQIYANYVKQQDKCGTPKSFPQEQQQTLLQKLEDTYLLSERSHRKPDSDSESLLYRAPNIAFAKFALYYGIAPLIAKKENSHRLLWDSLTVDSYKWCESGRMIVDNIALVKLYLGLGAEMNFRNAVKASLYEYSSAGDGWKSGEPEPILKDENNADDLEKSGSTRGFDQDNDDYYGYRYYRTPVTYWLEEYILRGFPTSMLETHRLLYPRFMKRASVKDVASILANPEKYKIPVNLNCPYRGAAPESGVTPDSDITASNLDATCPLTPSINMRDAMGRTPLHIAGLAKNKAVYDFLITQGADITIKDFRDNLPILK